MENLPHKQRGFVSSRKSKEVSSKSPASKVIRILILGAVIVISIPVVIIALFIYLLFVPVIWDNFAHGNVGKEYEGKYYSVSSDSNREYYMEKGELWPYYLQPGEVVYVNSAKYDNYFENVDVKFSIDFPCENLNDSYLSISPNLILAHTSLFDQSLEELPEEQVQAYCTSHSEL